jgi:hypothetical protein
MAETLANRAAAPEKRASGEVAEWFKREAADLPGAGHEAERS